MIENDETSLNLSFSLKQESDCARLLLKMFIKSTPCLETNFT